MLDAVIFDFDGIIVDTEPLHYRTFQNILDPLGLGYSWEEYCEVYMGFDDRDGFREAFRRGGRTLSEGELEEVIAAKAAAFQATVSAGVEAYPGVRELVLSLSGKVPLALCSGALPSDIHPILQGLGLADSFDVVVTAADVEASKPDPASYLLAVGRLQERFPVARLRPAHIVAIEDTPAGITSALGAGLRVLAVTNSYPAPRLSEATRTVSSLAGITREELATLV
ncbi:MAG TPA: HAD family phosphatase [Verrucomicrobiae bacterium]|nr:HAD family phosphatase [Verrucomicrobiae bacterium]